MALSSTFIFETKWKNTGNTISKNSLTIHAWSVRVFFIIGFVYLFDFQSVARIPW